jgi:hypothetical protein
MIDAILDASPYTLRGYMWAGCLDVRVVVAFRTYKMCTLQATVDRC